MQNKKIEVEIRSFISKEQYAKLLEFFRENAEFVKEDFQETHYFDCEEDLRIQKNNYFSKTWLKLGVDKDYDINDEHREEIQLKFDKDKFDDLQKFFKGLGYNVGIKWLRDRKQFDWDGIKVCLDYTRGYGYIIELEKMGTEETKDEMLRELREKLKELNIPLTPKEEFTKKYNHYKENWRELIKE